ncbi:PREDICTED: cytochrome f-like [Nicotiana attenuata]|uniref:cytochrome f-like n=1 Tax=Nicotiana attenuata TaxID=49451 RepID=UPI000904FE29|nr:PREDICTED: cytochrome f-like [Nicotiana attenuata]
MRHEIPRFSANCHLANKPVEIEFPQAVLPDTLFEAVVRIPYDMQLKQYLRAPSPRESYLRKPDLGRPPTASRRTRKKQRKMKKKPYLAKEKKLLPGRENYSLVEDLVGVGLAYTATLSPLLGTLCRTGYGSAALSHGKRKG